MSEQTNPESKNKAQSIHTIPKKLNIQCGFWNILADGLSYNEFMTAGGDSVCVNWNIRKKGIVSTLVEMLKICDFVVTVENDHFYWLLNELNKIYDIGGIYYIESDLKSPSNAKKYRIIDSSYSFKDECGIHAQIFSNIYKTEENCAYTCDDGIAIYYKKDKLQFISANKEAIHYDTNSYICNGNEQYMIAKFNLAESDVVISVGAAHLSSGEGEEKESKRVAKMKEILTDMNCLPNPIILLDRNCSEICEAEYTMETCGKVIANYGYKNLVNLPGFECLKMRHSRGNQPEKYGRFIFDSIDGILIKVSAQGFQNECSFGFGLYPSYLYNVFTEWRLNKRQTLYEYSVNANNVRGVESYQKHTDYDFDARDEYRWSQDMNKNTTQGLASLLKYNGVNELCQQNVKQQNVKQQNVKQDISAYTLDEQLHLILNYLYPNVDSPSDHPPISACIRLF